MKVLERTQFGNKILRTPARQLPVAEIVSPLIQELIANLHFTLTDKKLGIGLAAPQVGEGLAVAVIHIQKTATRRDVKEFALTIINPEIIEVFGRKVQQWEGCISSGVGKAGLFAKVPRYKKIKLSYQDKTGKNHYQVFEGLQAHVIQHEVDHLNGILFVDKVIDTKTFMTTAEYKRQKKLKII
jgi:peptide deformylase